MIQAPIKQEIWKKDYMMLDTVDSEGNEMGLYIAKYPVQVTPEVEDALRRIGYRPARWKKIKPEIIRWLSKELKMHVGDRNYEDVRGTYTATSIEIENRLGHLDWREQIPLAEALGGMRLTLRQGSDLIKLLLKGSSLYDGTGRRLDYEEKKKIKETMLDPTKPNHGEYFDSRFLFKGEKFMIYEGHYIDESGEQPRILWRFEKEIDRGVEGYGFASLNDLNEYGLAKKRSRRGGLNFRRPKKIKKHEFYYSGAKLTHREGDRFDPISQSTVAQFGCGTAGAINEANTFSIVLFPHHDLRSPEKGFRLAQVREDN